MMKRRDFLKLCLASGLGRTLPLISAGGLLNHDFVKKGNQLSIIHLEGGNDAFNTVVPFAMDAYYKKRPNLAIESESLLKLSDRFGLNPALQNIHARFKQGHVAIYLGIGYHNMSYSHTRAGQIWQSGEPLSLDDGIWTQKRLNLKLKPITVTGFDTHFNQSDAHQKALLELDEKVSKLNKDSVCFIYSEMGRSLKENDEGGTDHGHSNLAFLISEKVNGGIYGDYKDTETEFAIDFRDVISKIENLGIGRTV